MQNRQQTQQRGSQQEGARLPWDDHSLRGLQPATIVKVRAVESAPKTRFPLESDCRGDSASARETIKNEFKADDSPICMCLFLPISCLKGERASFSDIDLNTPQGAMWAQLVATAARVNPDLCYLRDRTSLTERIGNLLLLQPIYTRGRNVIGYVVLYYEKRGLQAGTLVEMERKREDAPPQWHIPVESGTGRPIYMSQLREPDEYWSFLMESAAAHRSMVPAFTWGAIPLVRDLVRSNRDKFIAEIKKINGSAADQDPHAADSVIAKLVLHRSNPRLPITQRIAFVALAGGDFRADGEAPLAALLSRDVMVRHLRSAIERDGGFASGELPSFETLSACFGDPSYGDGRIPLPCSAHVFNLPPRLRYPTVYFSLYLPHRAVLQDPGDVNFVVFADEYLRSRAARIGRALTPSEAARARADSVLAWGMSTVASDPLSTTATAKFVKRIRSFMENVRRIAKEGSSGGLDEATAYAFAIETVREFMHGSPKQIGEMGAAVVAHVDAHDAERRGAECKGLGSGTAAFAPRKGHPSAIPDVLFRHLAQFCEAEGLIGKDPSCILVAIIWSSLCSSSTFSSSLLGLMARVIVSGPPATGKSTLAELVEQLLLGVRRITRASALQNTTGESYLGDLMLMDETALPGASHSSANDPNRAKLEEALRVWKSVATDPVQIFRDLFWDNGVRSEMVTLAMKLGSEVRLTNYYPVESRIEDAVLSRMVLFEMFSDPSAAERVIANKSFASSAKEVREASGIARTAMQSAARAVHSIAYTVGLYQTCGVIPPTCTTLSDQFIYRVAYIISKWPFVGATMDARFWFQSIGNWAQSRSVLSAMSYLLRGCVDPSVPTDETQILTVTPGLFTTINDTAAALLMHSHRIFRPDLRRFLEVIRDAFVRDGALVGSSRDERKQEQSGGGASSSAPPQRRNQHKHSFSVFRGDYIVHSGLLGDFPRPNQTGGDQSHNGSQQPNAKSIPSMDTVLNHLAALLHQSIPHLKQHQIRVRIECLVSDFRLSESAPPRASPADRPIAVVGESCRIAVHAQLFCMPTDVVETAIRAALYQEFEPVTIFALRHSGGFDAEPNLVHEPFRLVYVPLASAVNADHTSGARQYEAQVGEALERHYAELLRDYRRDNGDVVPVKEMVSALLAALVVLVGGYYDPSDLPSFKTINLIDAKKILDPPLAEMEDAEYAVLRPSEKKAEKLAFEIGCLAVHAHMTAPVELVRKLDSMGVITDSASARRVALLESELVMDEGPHTSPEGRVELGYSVRRVRSACMLQNLPMPSGLMDAAIQRNAIPKKTLVRSFAPMPRDTIDAIRGRIHYRDFVDQLKRDGTQQDEDEEDVQVDTERLLAAARRRAEASARRGEGRAVRAREDDSILSAFAVFDAVQSSATSVQTALQRAVYKLRGDAWATDLQLRKGLSGSMNMPETPMHIISAEDALGQQARKKRRGGAGGESDDNAVNFVTRDGDRVGMIFCLGPRTEAKLCTDFIADTLRISPAEAEQHPQHVSVRRKVEAACVPQDAMSEVAAAVAELRRVAETGDTDRLQHRPGERDGQGSSPRKRLSESLNAVADALSKFVATLIECRVMPICGMHPAAYKTWLQLPGMERSKVFELVVSLVSAVATLENESDTEEAVTVAILTAMGERPPFILDRARVDVAHAQTVLTRMTTLSVENFAVPRVIYSYGGAASRQVRLCFEEPGGPRSKNVARLLLGDFAYCAWRAKEAERSPADRSRVETMMAVGAPSAAPGKPYWRGPDPDDAVAIETGRAVCVTDPPRDVRGMVEEFTHAARAFCKLVDMKRRKHYPPQYALYSTPIADAISMRKKRAVFWEEGAAADADAEETMFAGLGIRTDLLRDADAAAAAAISAANGAVAARPESKQAAEGVAISPPPPPPPRVYLPEPVEDGSSRGGIEDRVRFIQNIDWAPSASPTASLLSPTYIAREDSMLAFPEQRQQQQQQPLPPPPFPSPAEEYAPLPRQQQVGPVAKKRARVIEEDEEEIAVVVPDSPPTRQGSADTYAPRPSPTLAADESPLVLRRMSRLDGAERAHREDEVEEEEEAKQPQPEKRKKKKGRRKRGSSMGVLDIEAALSGDDSGDDEHGEESDNSLVGAFVVDDAEEEEEAHSDSEDSITRRRALDQAERAHSPSPLDVLQALRARKSKRVDADDEAARHARESPENTSARPSATSLEDAFG
jgi:hypothetical protein